MGRVGYVAGDRHQPVGASGACLVRAAQVIAGQAVGGGGQAGGVAAVGDDRPAVVEQAGHERPAQAA